MALLTGSRLGVYKVGPLIGAGRNGDVYRARDTVLGRDVAVKVLSGAITETPERITRLQHEARMLAALNHRNIGQIYSFEQSGTHHFLVLELIDGETLADHLSRAPLTIRQALDYTRQVADALTAAHARGIIHRDLKPANMMLTPSGVLKVLDFGLADTGSELLPAADGTDVDLESTIAVTDGRRAAIVGTIDYMSPEQTRGLPDDIGVQSDQYALGVIAYEMLTGHLPYDLSGNTPLDAFKAIRNTSPWPLSLIPRALRSDIEAVIFRTLQKESTARYPSTAAFAADVDCILRSTPIAIDRSRPIKRLSRWITHEARVWQAGTLGAVVYLCLAGFHAYWAWRAYGAIHGWSTVPSGFSPPYFFREMISAAVVLAAMVPVNVFVYKKQLWATAFCWLDAFGMTISLLRKGIIADADPSGSTSDLREALGALFVIIAVTGTVVYATALCAAYRANQLDRLGGVSDAGAQRLRSSSRTLGAAMIDRHPQPN